MGIANALKWTPQEKKLMADKLAAVMSEGKLTVFKYILNEVQSAIPEERRKKTASSWVHIDDVIKLCSTEIQEKCRAVQKSYKKGASFDPATMIVWTEEEREAFALAYWNLRDKSIDATYKSRLAMQQVIAKERHRFPRVPLKTDWFHGYIEFFEKEHKNKLEAQQRLSAPVKVQAEPEEFNEVPAPLMDELRFDAPLEPLPFIQLGDSEPELTFEEVLADSIARVVIRAARKAMPQITEMLKHSLLSSMLTNSATETTNTTQARHNPNPVSERKSHRLKVLVAGLRQDQKAMLLSEYESHFDLRIWTDDDSPDMLRQHARSVDYGIAQTSKMSHSNYLIAKQTLNSRGKALIAEKGGIDMIRNSLNTIANGALHTH